MLPQIIVVYSNNKMYPQSLSSLLCHYLTVQFSLVLFCLSRSTVGI